MIEKVNPSYPDKVSDINANIVAYTRAGQDTDFFIEIPSDLAEYLLFNQR